MVQTFFEYQGNKYKLKYQKISTAEGDIYQGMIFLKSVIGFSYLKAPDKPILFDNEFLDQQYRDLIVNVIEYKERRAKHKK